MERSEERIYNKRWQEEQRGVSSLVGRGGLVW